MENYENNEMMVNEEQTYDAPEEEKSSNGTWLLVSIGAGCALLGYGAKTLVEAVKHRAAKKGEPKEDKPKEKKGFKLFGKKKSEKKEETKETEKAGEAEAKKEES